MKMETKNRNWKVENRKWKAETRDRVVDREQSRFTTFGAEERGVWRKAARGRAPLACS